MSDLDKFIKNTEETVEKVRKAIAEYEASADNLDRLRQEAMREMERYEKVRNADGMKLDWAIDLFLEASELKMSVYEGVGEIEEAVDELFRAGLDDNDDDGFDLLDFETYPDDIKKEFNALPEDEQKVLLDELNVAAAEAANASAAAPKKKARRRRMSI